MCIVYVYTQNDLFTFFLDYHTNTMAMAKSQKLHYFSVF